MLFFALGSSQAASYICPTGKTPGGGKVEKLPVLFNLWMQVEIS